ncbi:uncharacterized protein LOC115883850 [Sitophilus oryzae]|uniref:Uncharacterized protein LOC115883850 n=1 Tax=Sitophilus oryzae TaxID=7048 RepID=A0A6J2Y544_SITOR|nr:uncharacterized protein LOC115883850 [Sitophilus oryzae]
MSKILALLTISYVFFQIKCVNSAQHTYNLGRNSAVVNTGVHKCANGRNSEVTFSVDATLHAKSTTRTNFGNGKNVNNRMRELNSQRSDHKGHILASVFGGPAQIWNLAPQADNLNRKYRCRTSILNVWYDCEKWILNELNSKRNLPVRVKVRLSYKDRSCRPTHWSIDARSRSGSGCQALNIRNGNLPFGACQRAG